MHVFFLLWTIHLCTFVSLYVLFDFIVLNQNIIIQYCSETTDFSLVTYPGLLQSFSLPKLHPFHSHIDLILSNQKPINKKAHPTFSFFLIIHFTWMYITIRKKRSVANVTLNVLNEFVISFKNHLTFYKT